MPMMVKHLSMMKVSVLSNTRLASLTFRHCLAMDTVLKAQVTAIKEDNSLAVNTKCSKMLALLEQGGLAWKQQLLASQVLVHPSNRCGQLINCFDAHNKGHMVLSIGCKLEKLNESMCFEVARDATKKQAQIQANTALATAAKGKVASVSGTERYLSVSSSHITQFVRAVAAGTCTTEHEALAKINNGLLTIDSLLAIFQDSGFETMVKSGWPWTVISAEVEEHFPWMPAFLQGSLNTSQQVMSTPTEMEQAMSLAFWFEQTNSVDQAIKYTKESMPLCAHYVPCIAQWVVKYGGGSGFPLVKLLQNIGALVGWCYFLSTEIGSAKIWSKSWNFH